MNRMTLYLIKHPEKRYEFALVDSYTLNSFHILPKVYESFDIDENMIKNKMNILRQTIDDEVSIVTRFYRYFGPVDDIRSNICKWIDTKEKAYEYPTKISKVSKKDIGDNRSERIRTTTVEILFVEVIRKVV